MIELLRRYLVPYKVKALIGILTKMVEVVFEVLTPLVVARMIDEGVRAGDLNVVVLLGAVLIVFALASYGSTFVCQRLAAQVSQGVGTDIRNALYSHVNKLSAADVDHFGTPSLLTRVTNDVNQVQLAVALGIRTLTRWPLLAAGSMIAAIAIDARLGLVFAVCLPAITLVFALVMRSSIPYYRAMQQRLDHVSLVVRETLSGMRVIRAFGQRGRETQRGHEAVAEQVDTAIGVGRLSALLNPATFVLMYGGIAVILYVGGMRVDVGDLSTGDVMAFVSYMMQTLVSISYLANLVVVLMRGQTSSKRIVEVLDREPSLVEGTRVADAGSIRDNDVAIELRHATLRYSDAAVAALEDVSLTLERGCTLGVIGGTGSGKSTLANLLPRMYDASVGEVIVFGEDVREYSFDVLKSLVSMVPQKAMLVSGTIRSNLLWRNDDASDEELVQALKTAQAYEFVSELPDGLEAPVEAGGTNFSGGQRQRLCIARALVGAPSVLILDDSASALDAATDARLRKALAAFGEELTTVIISQRVAAVRDAEAILVLDHGRMAGLGTHEELNRDCVLYREICASQMGEEEQHG